MLPLNVSSTPLQSHIHQQMQRLDEKIAAVGIDTDVTDTYKAFSALLAQGADQLPIAIIDEISWIIPAIYANKDSALRRLRSLPELAESKDFFSIEVTTLVFGVEKSEF